MLIPHFRQRLKKLSDVLEPRGGVVTLTLNLSRSGPLPPETKQFFKHAALKSLRQGGWPDAQPAALKKLADRIEEHVLHGIRPESEGLYLAAGPGFGNPTSSRFRCGTSSGSEVLRT
jgi:hypothetical protein